MIQISRLSKKYKGATDFSVHSLDLSIAEGEIFGLLGPNGAGKTTLISMLCSLLKPSSGSFSIGGMNYRTNKNKLRQRIGIVPQEYALYPSLSAFENLSYFGSMYGLRGKLLKDTIDQQLKIVGLTDFAHKKTKTFSGGMKRRLNLLSGLLHRPEVLFLDEPTVGVDVQSRTVILNYLRKLNAQGTTIIYTSHHLNEAENFCTRVAIIDHGELICEGQPKKLISAQEGAHHLEDLFLILTGKALRDYV